MFSPSNLGSGFSLLAFVKGQKRDVGYFDGLKANSRNVCDSMTFVTKSRNYSFIIFLSKRQTTVIGHKGCGVFLPFLISWTLTHFLMVEFGYLASTPTSPSTIPFAWERLQKRWPSGLCPRVFSHTVHNVTSELIGGCGASWRYEDCKSCPSCRRHGPEQERVLLLLLLICPDNLSRRSIWTPHLIRKL